MPRLAGQQTPPPAAPAAIEKHQYPSYGIQIEKVESSASNLPEEFRLALYENLIEEARKSGRFLMVFRSGDRSAASFPDLVILRARVEEFKPGSQRKRDVTTVAGATSIKVHVQVFTRDGRPVLDREVTGRVRFFGENLRATHNFARSVAGILRQTF